MRTSGTVQAPGGRKAETCIQETRREISQSAASGRAALDLLAEQRQGRPGTDRALDIDMSLRDLRLEAATTRSGAPDGPWPKPATDPFPGLSDAVPEIRAVDFDAEVLAGSILGRSCDEPTTRSS